MTESIMGLTRVVDTTNSKHAKLRPVPLEQVRLTDDFWEPKRRLNRRVTLFTQYRQLEESGVLDNFRRAAGKLDVPFRGRWFADSDLYKWLEAASWSLVTNPDSELERLIDSSIAEVAAAQDPSGYLDTYYPSHSSDARWTELPVTHEMYVAGHLIQAAIAHHRSTGKESLLNIATRLADHICEVFGFEEEGKRVGTDGHEEIEMALVELARETGDGRYLDQARFFVDVRGYSVLGDREYYRNHGLPGSLEYYQDHQPIRRQSEIVGHAVRALYFTVGATDLYTEIGDPVLLSALERLWTNMTTRRMYVTGGLGSRYEDEAFGKDYELPDDRAYSETCAAIASVMWNWRMLMLHGDAAYSDLMEITLYNAVLPGISLDGQHYFYQNPLFDDGTHRRKPWFGVACCPPNIARLLSALPGYLYSTSENCIWVHLYARSTASIVLNDDQAIVLHQQTDYPWSGKVQIEVESDGEFRLMLRIPGWCADASVSVNDEAVDWSPRPGGYAALDRRWRTGDKVHLTLGMPVRQVEKHPYVTDSKGKVALWRGPLLYCVEQVDNPEVELRDVVIPKEPEYSIEFNTELLNGVNSIRIPAKAIAPDESWRGQLYRVAGTQGASRESGEVQLTAVPYYAWANRNPGSMQVWLHSK